MQKAVEPTKKDQPSGFGEDIYTHPAFALASVSMGQSSGSVQFGSDRMHNNVVRFAVHRAELHQGNVREHYFPRELLIEFSMTHNQFAELITTPNRGVGTPITLRYAQASGSKLEDIPSIAKPVSKAEAIRNGIHANAKKQLEDIKKQVDAIGSLLDGKTISKKDLAAIHRDLVIRMGNLPANMEFVIEESEEALEKAVTSAKMDIEGYVTATVNRLGLDAARGIGLVGDSDIKFLGSE